MLIYQTEPELLDVFCEGPSDKLVFSSFAEAVGTNRTAVYTAQHIEWPEEIGSQGGNRSKIVFLSRQLAAKAVRGICVIDKDLDEIEDQTALNDHLIKTDYSCTPMYGLETEDLQSLIYSRFNLSITSDQFSRVFEACKHIFAVRFLREKHCLGASVAPPAEIFTEPTSFTISVQRFLDRCKQVNGYDVRWDKVVQEHDALFASLRSDFRHYINVHDLGAILGSIIRALKSRSVSVAPDLIEKHCLYVLLSQKLFGYPLFGELSVPLTA